MKKYVFSIVCFIVWGVMFDAPCLLAAADGYFLSLSQKKQILMTGEIDDAQGNTYDVHICPGYKAPTECAKEHWRLSGESFTLYGSSELYKDMREDSRALARWGVKDCLVTFTMKGVPQDWKHYFSRARKVTEKRVFGWWFAYPWATVQSVTSSSFRIPLGLVGTTLGISGAGVVPVFKIIAPTCEGLTEATMPGTILPLCGYLWNTIITPPLSLLGQKPAPSRVDGFWVSMNENPTHGNETRTPQSIDACVGLGMLLLTETRLLQESIVEIEQKKDAEVSALKQKIIQITEKADVEKQILEANIMEKISSVKATAVSEAVTATHMLNTLAGNEQKKTVSRLRREMKARGMSSNDSENIMNLLRMCDSKTYKNYSEEKAVYSKTDPVREVDAIAATVSQDFPQK